MDFPGFGSGSKQQVIRHFYLQREVVNRSLRLSQLMVTLYSFI